MKLLAFVSLKIILIMFNLFLLPSCSKSESLPFHAAGDVTRHNLSWAWNKTTLDYLFKNSLKYKLNADNLIADNSAANRRLQYWVDEMHRVSKEKYRPQLDSLESIKIDLFKNPLLRAWVEREYICFILDGVVLSEKFPNSIEDARSYASLKQIAALGPTGLTSLEDKNCNFNLGNDINGFTNV